MGVGEWLEGIERKRSRTWSRKKIQNKEIRRKYKQEKREQNEKEKERDR